MSSASPAALVDLRHRPPAARLAPLVRALVCVRIAPDACDAVPLHTVPHGSLVLSLQLTRPLASEEGRGLRWVGHALTGLRSASVRYLATPGTMTVVALLSPLGALRLLGTRSADIVDQRVPLCDLLPSVAWSELTTRLRTDWSSDPLRVLDPWLARRALDRRAVPAAARRAFRALELARRGNARRVPALVEELGVSRRQLERDCAAWLGVTPRQLLAVQRLQRALNLLQAGYPSAQVAALVGFADQAHQTRVLGAATGRSPRAWSLVTPTALAVAYKQATGETITV